MRAAIVAAMCAALLAVGCGYDFHVPGTGSAGTPLVEQAWLAGQMQTVGDFEGDVYEIEHYDDSSITLHAGRGSFGWVMIGLYTAEPDGFRSDAFAPGTHIESGIYDDGSAGNTDAVGCSGPSHGNWDFDGGADNLVIDVEEGPEPGTRLFHFDATYTDGQHTEGGFVLRAR